MLLVCLPWILLFRFVTFRREAATMIAFRKKRNAFEVHTHTQRGEGSAAADAATRVRARWKMHTHLANEIII